MSSRGTAWLEDLFRDHADAVLSYVRFRCADHHTAQEVVSETFLLAWRERDRLPSDRPQAWLYGTARRVRANQRRASGRREALLARIAAQPTIHSTAEPVEERLAVAQALLALPEKDREALVLLGWCELSNAEAAEVMGVTSAAFAVRAHRARRRLKAVLIRADLDDNPSLNISEVLA